MSQALFPFVVLHEAEKGQTPIATLSDGIHLVLIRVTSDGKSKLLFREDLGQLGLDPCAEYLASRERLVRLVRARLVRMRAVEGPGNVRCLAFEHSFLAASCAVLPDLFDLAYGHIRSESMLLAIPRRGLLVVAPGYSGVFRQELATLFGAEDRIFSLDPSGPAWLGKGLPQIGPANVSNDAMIPVTCQSVDDAEDTQRGSGHQPLRPYRQTAILKKRCA
jgi:hypothetical protein